MAGRLAETLTPSNLADMLDRTGVRHKVVIISACYSGVFIPRLADADTLVITAVDANHSSFGCRDKAEWTYFGDAFFNVALRRAESLNDAFLLARSLVLKREQRQGFDPSRPQMAGSRASSRLCPVSRVRLAREADRQSNPTERGRPAKALALMCARKPQAAASVFSATSTRATESSTFFVAVFRLLAVNSNCLKDAPSV
jgi:hypothetical protein